MEHLEHIEVSIKFGKLGLLVAFVIGAIFRRRCYTRRTFRTDYRTGSRR